MARVVARTPVRNQRPRLSPRGLTPCTAGERSTTRRAGRDATASPSTPPTGSGHAVRHALFAPGDINPGRGERRSARFISASRDQAHRSERAARAFLVARIDENKVSGRRCTGTARARHEGPATPASIPSVVRRATVSKVASRCRGRSSAPSRRRRRSRRDTTCLGRQRRRAPHGQYSPSTSLEIALATSKVVL